MSKPSKKLIGINKNPFIDRSIEENNKFSELTIRLETIDCILLLLDSKDDKVLLNVLRHIVEQVRRNEATILLLKEKNLLQLLLQKQFFRDNSNVFVKRLSLYLAAFIIENINCLVELETEKLYQIVRSSLLCYMQEDDDFCCEYLSVVINKCLQDPQCVVLVCKDSSFLLKYFSIIKTTSNPDILLHSLEMLHKLLLIQNTEERHHFATLATFPLNRLLCELNCEYFEIRKASLEVIHFLLLDPTANNVLNQDKWAAFLLEQLTKMFCDTTLPEESNLLVEVLVASMEHELMISLFFELNLFGKYVDSINNGALEKDGSCKALQVFAECAKYVKFVSRLVSADITEKFLECLLSSDDNPSSHLLLGLNRLMKSNLASKCIIESYDRGLIPKILKLLASTETNIKTREQSANLLENLLSYAFHKTAELVLDNNLPALMANVFSMGTEKSSIDLLLSLLNIIEILTAKANSRAQICKNNFLITNIGLLLQNSFSNAILVERLFRCLCCLVMEEETHDHLLAAFLCSSIKRALQSLSNQVKTAVTNFIMQTTRFPKLRDAYNGTAVLEVLLLQQKHKFCVPTWQPAIESILSKDLSMKFCIRNSLGFTDITVGHDFMVSKRKFSDFRIFQCILNEEVSPLQPVIVVNFNRPETPEDLKVKVPRSFFTEEEKSCLSDDWCYCRSPGDEFLPKYLQDVNSILEAENLVVNPLHFQKNIDFDNLTKRAKVIAKVVQRALGKDLKLLDLNSTEDCCNLAVKCHLKDLCVALHCSFIPLGHMRSGCEFERAILFKALADQIGLPCTLQRSVDGRILFNELPLPLEMDEGERCDKNTLSFVPWRLLRPTHIVDLMYNVGELYPLQSRQALQYLRLF